MSPGQLETMSEEADSQGLGRMESLGPHGGPGAFHEADGVCQFKARLTTHHATGHRFNPNFLEYI